MVGPGNTPENTSPLPGTPVYAGYRASKSGFFVFRQLDALGVLDQELALELNRLQAVLDVVRHSELKGVIRELSQASSSVSRSSFLLLQVHCFAKPETRLQPSHASSVFFVASF